MKKIFFALVIFFNVNTADAKIIVDNAWARLTPNGMGAVFFEI